MRAMPYKKVRQLLSLVIPQIEHLADTTMNDSALSAFLSPIAQACTPKSSPLTGEQLAVLSESVAHMKGKKVVKANLIANANRLIANWHFIRDSIPIPEWVGDPEYSDVLVIALHRKPLVVKGRVYHKARIRTYTGLCAGLVFTTLLSSSQLAAFVNHTAGVAKYRCAIEEVSGMEAIAVVSIGNKGEFKVRLDSCSEAHRARNKSLIEARINGRKCKRPIPCHVCKSTVQQCPLAIWWAEETNNE